MTGPLMATDCRESSTALLDQPLVIPDESVTPDEPLTPSETARSLDRPRSGVADSADAEPRVPPRERRKREPTRFGDFIELTKPRIVSMILVTTVASAWIGMSAKTGVMLSLPEWFALLLGTGLVAGSAGAANQVWERWIDPLMPRTASRPLASRRMSVATGVAFTAVLGLLGTVVLAWQFGPAPALVGLATWGVYVLVYTPMKTRTAWNTTVGAIAGALPVFMGYTAAGGQMTDLAGWMLFGVLACWQYPHFMAIAWLCRHQYAEAGFQMTTTIQPSGRSAGWQSIVGSIALAACGVTMCLAPAGDLILSVASLVTSLLVVAATWPLFVAAVRFARQRDDQHARKMMRWSLVVLPAVLLVMTLRVIGL
ncbi:protoheme IX farnesyltransferase [Allorhodopirellula solitaria]|uniref:Protoheme IX farnesyltransferase n=1 Tax=Allorhodopirellula solitaria TaxID=2527987 RepID=A0A5C5YH93_9BACT|nr:protoheme IX farnesyltransferase [Allorhodopirellula solitaria]TWT73885.1 Protoheme IX farnesyltransferase 1 [Allorhodopirellula solitaria]